MHGRKMTSIAKKMAKLRAMLTPTKKSSRRNTQTSNGYPSSELSGSETDSGTEDSAADGMNAQNDDKRDTNSQSGLWPENLMHKHHNCSHVAGIIPECDFILRQDLRKRICDKWSVAYSWTRRLHSLSNTRTHHIGQASRSARIVSVGGIRGM